MTMWRTEPRGSDIYAILGKMKWEHKRLTDDLIAEILIRQRNGMMNQLLSA